jgi:flagellar assembly protein FliH
MPSASTPRIETFEYPAGPEPYAPNWEGFLTTDTDGNSTRAGVVEHSAIRRTEEQERARAEKASEEEARRIFEAGRQQGFESGRNFERGAHAESEQERASQAAQWLRQFDQERQHYLSAVEHEVVELALEIAARVLRREAQMDPLLLTGAVRVALGQLSATTQARLRVPAADFALWTETLAHLPNLALKPELTADPQMHAGNCVLETDLGSVDLGIRAQLAEIERGFFDKAQAKPAEEPATVPHGEARGGHA